MDTNADSQIKAMTGRSPRPYLAATSDSYDAIAALYTDWISEQLAAKPHDRALLGAFAELVLAAEDGTVLDVGCGPGRITAFLAALGLQVRGLDLSANMVEQARRLYPGLDFDVGSMTALPYADASFSGLVAWHSIIHVPDIDLDLVFAEAARVLAPGGWFQLAFQLGDHTDHVTDLAGVEVDLDFHWRGLDEVLTRLEPHGFRAQVRIEREPDQIGAYSEATDQGYLLVRR